MTPIIDPMMFGLGLSPKLRQTVKTLLTVLLGAFHDRFIVFTYTGVTDFSVQGQLLDHSGRMPDWLYDEVHLCDTGLVLHLIEFEQCVERIECSDFSVSEMPIDGTK